MKHNDGLTPLAQELRRNMTKEERKLWYEFLSKYPQRFRRQVAFGNFIMDFYCASAKVAIELDGGQHYTPEGITRDRERTAFLEGNGIVVLRFANLEVTRNLPGVCETIDRTVRGRMC